MLVNSNIHVLVLPSLGDRCGFRFFFFKLVWNSESVSYLNIAIYKVKTKYSNCEEDELDMPWIIRDINAYQFHFILCRTWRHLSQLSDVQNQSIIELLIGRRSCHINKWCRAALLSQCVCFLTVSRHLVILTERKIHIKTSYRRCPRNLP